MNEEIKNSISSAVEELGYDLVDVQVKGTAPDRTIQCFIDREGGIQIEECVRLSRMLGDLLEDGLGADTGFRLEVSSPGIDRPLQSERDYIRNIGRDMVVRYENPDPDTITGCLMRVTDGIIEIRKAKESLKIPISTIKSAKIKLKW